MRPEITIRALADNWRSLTGWIAGTTLAAVMYASFYPQLADGQMAEAVASYPQAMRDALRMDDLTSAAGYLGSTVFGIILPLAAMLYGAFTGSRAVAGDEETGYLDLLLAHPASRTGLVLSRFAALAAGATGIAATVFVAMLAIRTSADLTGIAVAGFAAQCLNLALLAIVFGALGIGISAATGRRALVLALTAIIGVLAYALHAFARPIGVPGAARLSPFHYYIGGEPLRNGFQWTHTAVLAIASIVLVAAGTVWFNRRDINT
ncbi:ABC transporter permease subunit [Dactylosporangium sp. CA-152071]|uniref:ABC transporter permease subunit n=1 Tax=Dactylosporangium sp. CA-152071 TaxID=3239933 RepID=UPI003D8C7391